jgi:hypothetical protein
MSDTNSKTRTRTTTTTTTETRTTTHKINSTGPDYPFQGSTDFYDSVQTDEFTPSKNEIGLFEEHVRKQWEDGQDPPWIVPESEAKGISAVQQYVEWFNGIWHTGDPSSWGPQVFTDRAVMIDPSGISTGAKQAAANFLLLFKYFPGLRGLVVSWAANDREIIINWRFQIIRKGNKPPFLVPVIDKFCFLDGHVSFRLANFDIITLLGYLSETYGADQLLDFLRANSKMAARTGGIQRLPSIAWNLLSGLLYWPHPASTGLVANGSDGVVMLSWTPVQNVNVQRSYRICRSEALDGDYKPVCLTKVTEYRDESLVKEMRDTDPEPTILEWIAQKLHWPRTTTCWYTVSPVVEWKPVPVEKDQPISISPSRRQRLADFGLSAEGIAPPPGSVSKPAIPRHQRTPQNDEPQTGGERPL